MAPPSPSGLTQRRARRVGLELGGFLVAIGAVIGVRRGLTFVAMAASALGACLLALTATRSPLLVPIARRWMAFGTAISRITTPIVLTIIYLVVFTPMAWVRRVFGRSPIARRAGSASCWVHRPDQTSDEIRASMERQF